MILPDFLVINENGLYCRTGDFYLDPKRPVETAVISHAHGDHAIKGNLNVYATPPTAAIMELRYKKTAAGEFRRFIFNEPFFINKVKITFVPAGHILGSAQVLMEHGGTRYLYTGDIKLQDDPTCEKAELVDTDVLITETTFADPQTRHPDPVGQIQKLNAIPFPILLGAYSLGKSQRLIHLIGLHCPGKKVVVHHTIEPINRLYASFSFPIGSYSIYTRKILKEKEQNFIYIVPPLTFNSYSRATGVVRIFASGWKDLQVKGGNELYISDHADWNDLIHIVEKCRPREIWTLHGDGSLLREHFKETIPVKLLDR